jgi:uncharacterized Ntn-hydrolase superfamily protein
MTYSIVARDPATGELGVAVQSHYFAVGPIVPWAEPGVGAIATQANVEVSYGPRGLELLGRGIGAPAALAQLLSEDPQRDVRQVAIVDSSGAVAAHTGSQCMAYAGDVQGAQVSCQGNILVSTAVWPAMLGAYEASDGSLTARLLAALDAAQAQGGDIRGQQSAAILVVPATGNPWDKVLELRVEDHPAPLRELARLARLGDAYAVAIEGDEALAAGRHDEAARRFRRALELAPEADELRFWAALGAAQQGEIDLGLELVLEAIAVNPGWRELLERLTPETAPSAAALLDALG